MPRSLVAALVVVASTVFAVSPATAAPTPQNTPSAPTEDIAPPGATDGIPVGGDESAEPEPAASPGDGAASRAEVTTRYFSRQVYDDIRVAVAATPRPCSISDNGLAALVLSPIFRESSGAISPQTVPSPMTLSRYDEWDGTDGTTSNKATNRTLYESRDPSTPYPRAYWHPGIGIWQYDSAGLGAPYTAVERMDARIIAPGISGPMVTRYCAVKSDSGTDVAARAAAWRPWVGCATSGCEDVFRDMLSTGFANLTLVDNVSQLGGTQVRTCAIGDETFSCAYVDPAKAEGANWWATLTPNDGDPTSGTAPLSHPFYVFSADGREHRHWIRADTDYAVGISASRTLGKNARARTDQSGSGLTWSRDSELCDLTALRGDCEALPPEPRKYLRSSVGGNYRPTVGDFDGDGRDDIIWYGPGAAADYLWRWTSAGFSSTPLSVGGDYDPLVADFDGNGRDDIFWYGPGAASDYLWQWSGSGFESSARPVRGAYRPVVGDLDGSGGEDILWYAPGGGSDYLWRWSGSGFGSLQVGVGGNYRPVVADVDGSGSDDIVWYGPGTASDYLWRWSGSGFGSLQIGVGGDYRPVVGDLDGAGGDDILWYGRGGAPDYLWRWSGAAFSSLQVSVGGSHTPVVGNIIPGGGDEIVWYTAGEAQDHLSTWNGQGFSSQPVKLDVSYRPIVAQLDGTGLDDVFWYSPGPAADPLWYG